MRSFFIHSITLLFIWFSAKQLNKIVTLFILLVNAGKLKISSAEMMSLKRTTPPIITGVFAAIIKGCIGFSFVWLTYLTLSFFNIELTLLLVIAIGFILFLFNSDVSFLEGKSFNPLYARPIDYYLENLNPLIPIFEATGGIIGVVLGAFYFL